MGYQLIACRRNNYRAELSPVELKRASTSRSLIAFLPDANDS